MARDATFPGNFQKEANFFFFFNYNMTISTQYSIKHRNNVQKYVKIPSEVHVCTKTHNSTLKNKKAHTVGGGTPPPTPSPSGASLPRAWSLRSLAGGFQEIWNAPCGISAWLCYVKDQHENNFHLELCRRPLVCIPVAAPRFSLASQRRFFFCIALQK